MSNLQLEEATEMASRTHWGSHQTEPTVFPSRSSTNWAATKTAQAEGLLLKERTGQTARENRMILMETKEMLSNPCRIQIDKVWFKVYSRKVMDTMMILWITSINNMKKRNKIRETVTRELMQIRWTSSLCQKCLMELILMITKHQLPRIMENMKTKAQIWTLIRKIWHQRACWIKITMLNNSRYQMLRSKCQSIMEAVAQKWDKKVITKWPVTSTQRLCFKVTYYLLTTIWKTETATLSSRDTPTSNVSVPLQGSRCTVASAQRCWAPTTSLTRPSSNS